MKHISRIISVTVAGLYGICAIPFVVAGLLPIALALSEPATGHIDVTTQLLASTFFIAIASVLFAAAIGLFKEKRWARWPFLAVAIFALAGVIKTVPFSVAMLDHFHSPPEGAYVVLSESDLTSNLEHFFFPGVWLFLFTTSAAIFVFHRTK